MTTNSAPARSFARSFIDAFDEPDRVATLALLAPGFTAHVLGAPRPMTGPEWLDFAAGFRAAFPDARHYIQDITVDGDRTAMRFVWSGTQRGPLMGLPATGRRVAINALGVMRVERGAIAEIFVYPDIPGILEQLAGAAQPVVWSTEERDPRRRRDEAEAKAIVRRLYEAIDADVASAALETCSPGIVMHMGSRPPLSLDGMIALGGAFQQAFPDGVHHIVDQFAEGERVVTRLRYEGTHRGELMGVPATGRRVSISGASLERVVAKKIVERWVIADLAGLMQQLGAVPKAA